MTLQRFLRSSLCTRGLSPVRSARRAPSGLALALLTGGAVLLAADGCDKKIRMPPPTPPVNNNDVDMSTAPARHGDGGEPDRDAADADQHCPDAGTVKRRAFDEADRTELRQGARVRFAGTEASDVTSTARPSFALTLPAKLGAWGKVAVEVTCRVASR